MTEHTKKVRKVEAIKWTGDNFNEISQFVGNNHVLYDYRGLVIDPNDCPISIGDMIIKDPTGEISHKPKIIFDLLCETGKFSNTIKEKASDEVSESELSDIEKLGNIFIEKIKHSLPNKQISKMVKYCLEILESTNKESELLDLDYECANCVHCDIEKKWCRQYDIKVEDKASVLCAYFEETKQ